MKALHLISLVAAATILAVSVYAGIQQPSLLNPWPWTSGSFDGMHLLVGVPAVAAFLVAVVSIVGIVSARPNRQGFPVEPLRPSPGV